LGISHTIWPEGHDPGWGLALIGIAIILLARRAINRRSKDRH
jgi:MYXO-CTERM domain-containing protein